MFAVSNAHVPPKAFCHVVEVGHDSLGDKSREKVGGATEPGKSRPSSFHLIDRVIHSVRGKGEALGKSAAHSVRCPIGRIDQAPHVPRDGRWSIKSGG